jgi:hypothetical protein
LTAEARRSAQNFGARHYCRQNFGGRACQCFPLAVLARPPMFGTGAGCL